MGVTEKIIIRVFDEVKPGIRFKGEERICPEKSM
jgi:hypothetical protein